MTEHRGAITFLVEIEGDRFCSGGTDQQLCFWNFSGDLLATIKRQEEESTLESLILLDLVGLLALPNNRLITACNDKAAMLVYDTKKYCYLNKPLTGHQENVQILKEIDESSFVSGSLDGTMIIWDSKELTMIRKITLDRNEWKIPNNIFFRCINIINKTFLCAGIGNGFVVYKIKGDCILKKTHAHKGLLNDLITVHSNQVLVTCSDDSAIMFWKFLDNESLEPLTIGAVYYHSGAVSNLLKLSEWNFASVSTSEHNLVVWKDSRIEKMKRSYYASRYVTCTKRGNGTVDTELSLFTDDEYGSKTEEFDIETNV